MKKFLRKANRGLILGGILVIGLAVYIVTDLNRFKTEKPLIEQTVKEFSAALSDYNVTPEKYRELNAQYSTADSDKRIEEFSQFTDKYWLSVEDAYNDMYGWASLKEDFRSSMKQLLDNKDKGYITEFSADLTDCKVNKDGPNCAVMTCTANLYFVGTENCTIICPGGYDDTYSWRDEEAGEPEVVKTSVNQECTFYLERTSDGWKITKCEFYDMDSYITPVEDDESDENA
ncbi:MAG: hypothetical protein E7497_01450 [Ruminococcus sp.]|nr:hypothetical protein [Ruminococcus sp.]